MKTINFYIGEARRFFSYEGEAFHMYENRGLSKAYLIASGEYEMRFNHPGDDESAKYAVEGHFVTYAVEVHSDDLSRLEGGNFYFDETSLYSYVPLKGEGFESIFDEGGFFELDAYVYAGEDEPEFTEYNLDYFDDEESRMFVVTKPEIFPRMNKEDGDMRILPIRIRIWRK